MASLVFDEPNEDAQNVFSMAKKKPKPIADLVSKASGIDISADDVKKGIEPATKAIGNIKAKVESGEEPTEDDLSDLGSVDESKPEDHWSNDSKKKVFMALSASLPIILGGAFGGAEGAAMGGKTGAGIIGSVQESEEKRRKEAEELKGKKEIRQLEIDAAEKKKEDDRAFQKQLYGMQSADKKEMQQNLLDLKREELEAKKEKGGGLTKGQEALDRSFAKQYDDYKAQGGSATVQSNLEELKAIRDSLAKTDSATGPVIGNIPKGVREVVLPKSADIQDRIERIITQNLRATFGPQFTEKEGQNFIKRSYNPALSEKQNIDRLNKSIETLQQQADAKDAASAYFEENGTLKGFKAQDFSAKSKEPEHMSDDELDAELARLKAGK